MNALRRWTLRVILAATIAGAAVWQHDQTKPHVIGFNPGGSLTAFIDEYDALRRSGREVILDGICMSACTLVVGLVPHERICVTPYGRLAFHSAYILTPLGPQFSSEGTRLLWQVYPEKFRNLLRSRGWDGDVRERAEHPAMIYLGPEDLQPVFRNC